MGRERHSEGYVELVGTRQKRWKGHFYVYIADKRHHRSRILGIKSSHTDLKSTPALIRTKHEAEELLRDIIKSEGTNDAAPSPSPLNTPFTPTLGWFWAERYLPMAEANWSRTTRITSLSIARLHLFKKFSATPLKDIQKFHLQVHINELAEKGYSFSLIHKTRVLLKLMLEEAVEMDIIQKNPARKLKIPPSVPKVKDERVLTIEEAQELFGELTGRDRLMFHILMVGALRPGELFALRKRSVIPGLGIFIDQSATSGVVKGTKTAGSEAPVYLPAGLQKELENWCECIESDEALIFPTRNGRPLYSRNFLRDSIWPALERVNERRRSKGLERIERFNHRAMRRTFATLASGGEVAAGLKDVQGQLRHASITTTMGVYAKVIPESQRGAVERFEKVLGLGRKVQ